MDSLKMYGGIALRHGLTYLAGIAMAKGWVDAHEADVVVGSLMAVAAVGLSIFSKYKAKKVAE